MHAPLARVQLHSGEPIETQRVYTREVFRRSRTTSVRNAVGLRFLGNQWASPEQLDQQHRALTPNYCDPLSAEPSIIRLLFQNDIGQPTRRQTPLACSASCAWALPRNPQITAWLHLAAKPARPRLDEFLSGRCPDRIRCLRRLLSCRSGLAERSGRSGAYCWDAGW